MSEKNITVAINDVTETYAAGTRYLEIAKLHQKDEQYPIVLVRANGRLRELNKKAEDGCRIEFVTTNSKAGRSTYLRSLIMLMLKAMYHVVGDNSNIDRVGIHFSVGDGYYCTMQGRMQLTQKFLDEVKAYMEQMVREVHPIVKTSENTYEACQKFGKYRMYDKEELFRYRRASKVNLYNLAGFEDYFYGYMAYSTGILKYYELIPYDEGFVLQMPVKKSPKVVPEFVPQNKVSNALKESARWAERLGVATIGQVNDKITDGTINDIMMVQEALQEKKIADIASDIASREDVKVVMIAGPSSSGKTSFAHRLCIQLMAQGMKPHPISTDNYFVNREDTPIDEEGKLDYEVLEAVDVELFNRQMTELLEGKQVELPDFDFVLGKRTFNGNYVKLEDDDILVIEGIHCLNDELSYSLPKDTKYRIYVSALTPLNVDEHNRISTSDLRLLRRIVRDIRTRGTSAEHTIEMWKRVRRGEEKYIFPYQDSADAVFNSVMVYELSVLKVFAEPALFSVPEGTDEYLEAKRLLKFLDYILSLPKENIPHNSILSEFVGGSVFPV